jgi:hypothetical protein
VGAGGLKGWCGCKKGWGGGGGRVISIEKDCTRSACRWHDVGLPSEREPNILNLSRKIFVCCSFFYYLKIKGELVKCFAKFKRASWKA